VREPPIRPDQIGGDKAARRQPALGEDRAGVLEHAPIAVVEGDCRERPATTLASIDRPQRGVEVYHVVVAREVRHPAAELGRRNRDRVARDVGDAVEREDAHRMCAAKCPQRVADGPKDAERRQSDYRLREPARVRRQPSHRWTAARVSATSSR
jgi:hypothetical protein